MDRSDKPGGAHSATVTEGGQDHRLCVRQSLDEINARVQRLEVQLVEILRRLPSDHEKWMVVAESGDD
jgi:uncharacterized protein YPO0396